MPHHDLDTTEAPRQRGLWAAIKRTQAKVKWAAWAAYIGATTAGVTLVALVDSGALQGLPGYLSAPALALVPLLAAWITGYAKRNRPT